MNIKPLSDHIVIEPLKQEEKTKSGILLPQTAEKERPEQGKVKGSQKPFARGSFFTRTFVIRQIKKLALRCTSLLAFFKSEDSREDYGGGRNQYPPHSRQQISPPTGRVIASG